MLQQRETRTGRNRPWYELETDIQTVLDSRKIAICRMTPTDVSLLFLAFTMAVNEMLSSIVRLRRNILSRFPFRFLSSTGLGIFCNLVVSRRVVRLHSQPYPKMTESCQMK